MSTDAISPLRQRMIEDMSARQLHPATQKGHIRACKRFATFLKRSPDTATSDDLRRFQLHLAESGLSICTRNRTVTALRFLFRVTLRRLDHISAWTVPQGFPAPENSCQTVPIPEIGAKRAALYRPLSYAGRKRPPNGNLRGPAMRIILSRFSHMYAFSVLPGEQR